jgi:prepilin-type N-terminal cleavage/methylation domain-containing protein
MTEHRQSQRGYTAIEVMLAIAVMGIGAAGVMSMQRGSIVGDLESRRMDVANSIARTWIERLRRDATAWTGPNAYVAADTTLPFTNFGVAGAPASVQAGWYQPQIPTVYTAADGLSPMFDALGRDLILADAANSVYCVVIKVDPIVANGNYTSPPSTGNAAPLEMVRETVVVFWPKQLTWAANSPLACPSFVTGSGKDPVSLEAASPGTYHFLFASTPIMKNLL